jgi:hypothetical protein
VGKTSISKPSRICGPNCWKPIPRLRFERFATNRPFWLKPKAFGRQREFYRITFAKCRSASQRLPDGPECVPCGEFIRIWHLAKLNLLVRGYDADRRLHYRIAPRGLARLAWLVPKPEPPTVLELIASVFPTKDQEN